jgi:hypothetical protein
MGFPFGTEGFVSLVVERLESGNKSSNSSFDIGLVTSIGFIMLLTSTFSSFAKNVAASSFRVLGCLELFLSIFFFGVEVDGRDFETITGSFGMVIPFSSCILSSETWFRFLKYADLGFAFAAADACDGERNILL